MLAQDGGQGQNVAWSGAYPPWGEAQPAAGFGPRPVPWGFAGRRFDAATGLYQYRARMYSVAPGRFLQTDPVGYADQINLYASVGNDPLNATDPSGRNISIFLFACCDW